MSEKKLKDAFVKFKDALKSVDPGDKEDRAILAELSAAIEEKLAQPSAAGQDDLEERLKEQAVEFKVKHPRIASLLDEIADILTHLGI